MVVDLLGFSNTTIIELTENGQRNIKYTLSGLLGKYASLMDRGWVEWFKLTSKQFKLKWKSNKETVLK